MVHCVGDIEPTRMQIQGIAADKRAAAVEQKIEEMGLRQYADRPAGGYSGGNKRKLSVAMAMIGDPQVCRKATFGLVEG